MRLIEDNQFPIWFWIQRLWCFNYKFLKNARVRKGRFEGLDNKTTFFSFTLQHNVGAISAVVNILLLVQLQPNIWGGCNPFLLNKGALLIS
jgi:hypothetical protein